MNASRTFLHTLGVVACGLGMAAGTNSARALDAPSSQDVSLPSIAGSVPDSPILKPTLPAAVDKTQRGRGTAFSSVQATVIEPVATLPPSVTETPPLQRRRSIEDDPYAPVGIRVGGVVVSPSIEAGGGYDTNPNRTSRAKGSTFYRIDGGLDVNSDWSVHELKGTLRGGYSAYPNTKGADRPDGDGVLKLRLDVTRDTRIDNEVRGHIETQRPGSPDLTTAVRDRPIVGSFGASTGLTHTFNRLSIGAAVDADRTLYEDAKLTNGATLDQGDRDRSAFGVRLRAGYEVNPGVTPFVEAGVDTRTYDRTRDDEGYRRGSDGMTGRIGTTVEVTRTLTGEGSVGYQKRRYDDARLRDLQGLIGEASLLWSATPLTTVRLTAAAGLDETSLPGVSGVRTEHAGVEVTHSLRRNLTVTGALDASRADYQGIPITEDGFTGSAQIEYKINRSLGVRASFVHEHLSSTVPGADYTANVYLVGLRLQR